MIPAELDAQIIDLPAVDSYRIVIVTGTELRHDRFALRLQFEFPGLVAAWLQVVPASQCGGVSNPAIYRRLTKLRASLSALGHGMPQILASRLGRRAVVERTRKFCERAWSRLAYKSLRRDTSQRTVEQRLFGDEIERLRKAAYVTPTVVQNPNSAQVIASIKALDPYFILTLGGAIYGKALCACARGLALNQHDGWCPEYRGSYTVDWALYHRDLSKVSNTIHILTDGMDSGPILRRSSACLAMDDTPESCFARSVALGTELMCETVREVIETKRARIYLQPQFAGYTYIGQHLTADIRHTIRIDLQRGLIRNDVARRTNF
jgi:methionyl-tRNA formyltransferase